MAASAAVDFEAFYQERRAANDVLDETTDLLMRTFDGKGIVMVPDDLRPATPNAARGGGQRVADLYEPRWASCQPKSPTASYSPQLLRTGTRRGRPRRHHEDGVMGHGAGLVLRPLGDASRVAHPGRRSKTHRSDPVGVCAAPPRNEDGPRNNAGRERRTAAR
jgi:hypothetical protein